MLDLSSQAAASSGFVSHDLLRCLSELMHSLFIMGSFCLPSLISQRKFVFAESKRLLSSIEVDPLPSRRCEHPYEGEVSRVVSDIDSETAPSD